VEGAGGEGKRKGGGHKGLGKGIGGGEREGGGGRSEEHTSELQ